MHILVLYGSLAGQTEKISNRIAEIIRGKGYKVTVLSGERLPSDFSENNYDAVIIGGPIHIGKYPKYIKAFITTHSGWLNNVPSALFTVCMAVNSKHEKSRAEALHYGEKLIVQTGWQPRLTETFAGSVKYTQYNFVTRFIMKQISKKEGGSTDTSCDHEYTDWTSVKRFAENFMVIISAQ